jgi:IS30 family transposase
MRHDCKPRKMTPDLVELIEEKLTQEQWSPDQISGRLAKDGVAFISHERIYQHVWKDKKDGGILRGAGIISMARLMVSMTCPVRLDGKNPWGARA